MNTLIATPLFPCLMRTEFSPCVLQHQIQIHAFATVLSHMILSGYFVLNTYTPFK